MNEALITLCRSFRSALGSCTPAITTISPYRKIAEEIVEMATAYKEDDGSFTREMIPSMHLLHGITAMAGLMPGHTLESSIQILNFPELMGVSI